MEVHPFWVLVFLYLVHLYLTYRRDLCEDLRAEVFARGYHDPHFNYALRTYSKEGVHLALSKYPKNVRQLLIETYFSKFHGEEIEDQLMFLSSTFNEIVNDELAVALLYYDSPNIYELNRLGWETTKEFYHKLDSNYPPDYGKVVRANLKKCKFAENLQESD